MAGVGKSSVARRLAVELGLPWFDVDAAVSNERHGRTVAAIFEEVGEAGFRDLEAAQLAAALASDTPTVIATGGGIVERPANRSALRDRAVVVWLRADQAVLADRLRHSSVRRPLLEGDVAANLAALSERRAAWYDDVADVAVDVGGTDLAGAVRAVRDALPPEWVDLLADAAKRAGTS